ncbi:MAG: pyridoxal 5'-phosphate synthase glutaminase subunit PdxT [Anaerolinea sp.]|jgi:5'-phosphate synthase pdxT subunit|nr:pyridoxal 5'-phosphate synthase glutaminase subunit PdxT [Anaerolinea sp.]
MNIGVLALQGDFLEHQKMLEQLGARVIQVRLPQHLQDLDGLIIPGGESTTIGKLAVEFGLMEPLRAFAQDHAIWGTCAGAIFLARDIGRDQPLLGVMDITVERNAFGRQVDSFATDLDVPVLKEVDPVDRPFRAVFIRAPRIAKANGTTRLLATLADGTIVAVRQNRWLATSFHPELTGDDRFHRYFMEMALSKHDH